VVVPSALVFVTSIEQRVRRFFGLSASQSPQSPWMRGTPPDDPHPKMRNVTVIK
jgi:hypothetical protein